MSAPLSFKEVVLTSQTHETEPGVLVVLGVDAESKPHASKFPLADRELVLRAAGLMGFRVIELGAGDVAGLRVAIPAGKVFATGKGFVPFVKRELYEQLALKLGTAAELPVPAPVVAPASRKTAAPAAIQASPPQATLHLGAPWMELVVGDLVLARDDEYESWF